MIQVNQHDNSEIRTVLLAEIAEQYFIEGKTQAQIARGIGVDRSMVSRWLTEARKVGIVDIRVNWPVVVDNQLEEKLIDTFDLRGASVVVEQANRPDGLLGNMGKACSWLLKNHLKEGTTIGIGLGSAIREVIDELDGRVKPISGVVQLVGSLGSHNRTLDGHDLVLRTAEKVGGETFFLNAPFILENSELAEALRRNRSIKETLEKAGDCDLALVGIGNIEHEKEIYLEAGYMQPRDLEYLASEDVVGEVCGLHFTLHGEIVAEEYEKRLITVDKETLLEIPERIGVAGGLAKIEAILGALRGKLVNILVTDYLVAEELLRVGAV
jgi:deoxyribonucleoside regulator